MDTTHQKHFSSFLMSCFSWSQRAEFQKPKFCMWQKFWQTTPRPPAEKLKIFLLFGFFRGQVSRKVNIHYYDKLGHSFYYKAAHFCSDTTRARLLMTMSVRLPIWLQVCYKLHKEFRKNRLYSPEFRREN